MILLKIFWTPFWAPIVVYPNVKTNCQFIAVYTIVVSIFLMAYVVDMQNEKSFHKYNPFFEIDINKFNFYEVLSLLFFTYMIGSSLLLLKGLKDNLRVFLLPWIIGMEIIILSLFIWSIWLLKKYYIYINTACAALLYWMLTLIQFICWACVCTQYHKISQIEPSYIELRAL